MALTFTIIIVCVITVYLIGYVFAKLSSNYADKYLPAILAFLLSLTVPYFVGYIQGYPFETEINNLPTKFTLEWANIEKPLNSEQTDCRIMLLLTYNKKTRLYSVPYSEQLDKEVSSMIEKMQNGEVVNVDQSQKGKNAKDGGTSGEAGKECHGGMSLSDEYIFYVLPDPLTTRKDK